ncbi:MAG: hypothetical protein QME66_08500 [Candidatus Eisenbacteria bacterium]|nr:hypothetical protein [Candidatus Eisenbacteria bacterium]
MLGLSPQKGLLQSCIIAALLALSAQPKIVEGEILFSRLLGLNLPASVVSDSMPETNRGFLEHLSLLPRPTGPRVFCRLIVEDVLRSRGSDGREEKIENSIATVGVAIPFGQNYTPSVIGVSFSGVDLATRYSNAHEQKLAYGGAFSDYVVWYRGDFDSRVNFAGWFKERKLADGWQDHYSAEIYFHPVRAGGLGYSYCRTNLDQSLTFEVRDEGGVLPIEAEVVAESYFLTGRLLKRFSLWLEAVRYSFEPSTGQLSASQFELVPDGRFRQELGELTMSFFGRWSARLAYKQGGLDASGDFFYYGQKFGKVTRGHFAFSSVAGGLGFHSPTRALSVDYEHFDLSDSLRGHVQSWPFVSAIFRLLGDRTYFRGIGGARMDKLRFTYSQDCRSGGKLASGMTYFHVVPSGEWQTWEPLLFVFGVKNFKRHLSSLVEADAILLSLGGKYPFRNLDFSGSVSQLIPVHVKKAETSPPSAPGGAPAVRVTTDGGRFYEFGIEYRF